MEKKVVCLLCNSMFNKIPDNHICPECSYDQFGEYNVKWQDSGKQGLIIKFGDLSTLESMRNGNIWFQSPKYYQDYKGNPAVCDVSECAYDYILSLSAEKIKEIFGIDFCVGQKFTSNDGREFILKEIKDAKLYVYSNTQNYNRLLCFYLLSIRDGQIVELDEKLKSFGTHYSIVKLNELQRKIMAYAVDNDVCCFPTNVKYITDAYHGAYNPTFKDTSYSYQNEYRFIISGEKINDLGEKEALKIKLDGMDDVMTEPQSIDSLFETKTLTELLKLQGIEE